MKVLAHILPTICHEYQIRCLVIVELAAKTVVIKFSRNYRTISQGSYIENAILSTIIIRRRSHSKNLTRIPNPLHLLSIMTRWRYDGLRISFWIVNVYHLVF